MRSSFGHLKKRVFDASIKWPKFQTFLRSIEPCFSYFKLSFNFNRTWYILSICQLNYQQRGQVVTVSFSHPTTVSFSESLFCVRYMLFYHVSVCWCGSNKYVICKICKLDDSNKYDMYLHFWQNFISHKANSFTDSIGMHFLC